MATVVGPLLLADKCSPSKGDRDAFLTLLDLQPGGMPLRLNHCDCDGCEVGEVVDLMMSDDGRTWCVATTDLPRSHVEGYSFSLGGRVVDDEPADLVTPRLLLLHEVSVVERSASAAGPIRWQPGTISSLDRGGYARGTTAVERQVLDHAAGRMRYQSRAGVIEVITLPSLTPAPVVAMAGARSMRTAQDPGALDDDDDPFAGPPITPTRIGADGLMLHTRYLGRITKVH